MRAVTRNVATAILLAALPIAALSAQVRGVMREVLDAVTVLLPAAADEEGFRDPASRDRILRALRTLSDNADALRGHGGDRGFEYLREALVTDAGEALDAYRREEYPIARFVVRHVIENCFACHTRLPAAEPGDLGRQLTSAVDLERLDLSEQVRVLVATRRFDQALEAAEQAMIAPDLDPAELGLSGILEDYLKIAIRVRSDLGRPVDALRRLLRRDDLPLYLKLQVTDWLIALEELQGWEPGADLLEAGRDLLEEARRRNLYLQDRRGMIHSLLASAALHRYVSSPSVEARDQAEAYYLLGVAESSISRTAWIPETEFFLETSIRLDPDAAFASRAYAFLERYVLTSYSGSDGTHVPADVWARLIELRRLVEAR